MKNCSMTLFWLFLVLISAYISQHVQTLLVRNNDTDEASNFLRSHYNHYHYYYYYCTNYLANIDVK